MDPVFVRCAFAPPAAGPAARERIARALAAGAAGIAWRGAALATHGRRAILWCVAPDARRVASALEPWALDVEDVWAGSVEGPPTTPPGNVVVERCRTGGAAGPGDPPPPGVSADWCLRTHRVRLVRRLVSRDGRRVVLMYDAPDAESVRLAERHAGNRADAVWSFAWIAADGLPARGYSPT